MDLNIDPLNLKSYIYLAQLIKFITWNARPAIKLVPLRAYLLSIKILIKWGGPSLIFFRCLSRASQKLDSASICFSLKLSLPCAIITSLTSLQKNPNFKTYQSLDQIKRKIRICFLTSSMKISKISSGTKSFFQLWREFKETKS